jgi:hypothetical protein
MHRTTILDRNEQNPVLSQFVGALYRVFSLRNILAGLLMKLQQRPTLAEPNLGNPKAEQALQQCVLCILF